MEPQKTTNGNANDFVSFTNELKLNKQQLNHKYFIKSIENNYFETKILSFKNKKLENDALKLLNNFKSSKITTDLYLLIQNSVKEFDENNFAGENIVAFTKKLNEDVVKHLVQLYKVHKTDDLRDLLKQIQDDASIEELVNYQQILSFLKEVYYKLVNDDKDWNFLLQQVALEHSPFISLLRTRYHDETHAKFFENFLHANNQNRAAWITQIGDLYKHMNSNAGMIEAERNAAKSLEKYLTRYNSIITRQLINFEEGFIKLLIKLDFDKTIIDPLVKQIVIIEDIIFNTKDTANTIEVLNQLEKIRSLDESSLRFLNRAANVVFKEFADGKISIEKALEIFKKLKVKYNGLFVYTDNFYKNELSTKGLSSDRMERKSNFLKLVARANVNHTISTFSKKLDSEYKKYKLTYVNYLNKFEKQKNSVNNVKELNRAA